MKNYMKILITLAIIVVVILYLREIGLGCGNPFIGFLCKK